ncbi:SPC18 [Auxenochlorella protothecoides x Auxenochlorella symbiontica]|uniref:Signal peptidase complex catalytic subunit SEC11 n=2 Tax=Auxenochlorella protothecoides TaxID=3075 RepID=A0A087SM88_AUXPR|nr:Signal peptidase complex catalytic subunit SEC11C [Auxenochlorella protothecoides]KFM26842.1 Signal peptidase complex catalytic subunit SEC11C [Auxenochlorella protothecoides]
MQLIRSAVAEVKKMQKRQLLLQGVNLGLIITSALMIWKFLVLVTGSESPIVVVLSGSMEPGFYRGDILFLDQPKGPIETGNIIVFNAGDREIPIVHRIIKVHERHNNISAVDILTKGDNNWGDDRSLYPRGVRWLGRHHIMGRVIGYLPYIGQVTIIMNDYPIVKVLLIAALGLFVITSKE